MDSYTHTLPFPVLEVVAKGMEGRDVLLQLEQAYGTSSSIQSEKENIDADGRQ
jgi:hypothetical protein